MKNNTPLFIGILLILLSGLTFYIVKNKPASEKNFDTNTQDLPSNGGVVITPTTNPFDQYKNSKTLISNLADVTESRTYGYVVYNGDAMGQAKANLTNDKYTLTATFQNLPNPGDDYFYEGWVVKQGEQLNVISTGEALLNQDGQYINNFDSSEDLTDHTFYVLTLEPKDNNPEPAFHILEGTLVLQNN